MKPLKEHWPKGVAEELISQLQETATYRKEGNPESEHEQSMAKGVELAINIVTAFLEREAEKEKSELERLTYGTEIGYLHNGKQEGGQEVIRLTIAKVKQVTLGAKTKTVKTDKLRGFDVEYLERAEAWMGGDLWIIGEPFFFTKEREARLKRGLTGGLTKEKMPVLFPDGNLYGDTKDTTEQNQKTE